MTPWHAPRWGSGAAPNGHSAPSCDSAARPALCWLPPQPRRDSDLGRQGDREAGGRGLCCAQTACAPGGKALPLTTPPTRYTPSLTGSQRSWTPGPGDTRKQGRPWVALGATVSYKPEASPFCPMSWILNNTTSSHLAPHPPRESGTGTPGRQTPATAVVGKQPSFPSCSSSGRWRREVGGHSLTMRHAQLRSTARTSGGDLERAGRE